MIFPLPQRSAVIADRGQNTSAGDDESDRLAWKPGRWQNANKVRKNDGPYGQRVIERSDGKSITSNGWSTERRFGSALSSATNGQQISDEGQGNEWYETLTDHYHLEIKSSAHNRNFRGKNPMPDIKGEYPKHAGLPRTRLPIANDKQIDGDGGNSVQLQAIEVLNYFEPRESAISDQETTESAYLVFHVCVQDCNGTQLRHISRSLSTHRHGSVDDFTDQFSHELRFSGLICSPREEAIHVSVSLSRMWVGFGRARQDTDSDTIQGHNTRQKRLPVGITTRGNRSRNLAL